MQGPGGTNNRRVNVHCLASNKMVGFVMSEDYKKETEKLGKHVIEKMSSFKFG